MPNLERFYVDSIFKACNKYASFSPAQKIDIGDYGTVDSETCEFVKQGSIYDSRFQDVLTAAGVDLVMANYPVQVGQREDEFTIHSLNTQRLKFGVGPKGTIAGIVEAVFTSKFTIQDAKRSSVLAMVKPRTLFLPREVLLEKLAQVSLLTDAVLITEVYCCHAYNLCVSSEESREISIALSASSPLANLPVAGIGGGVDLTWQVQGQCDLKRSAVGPGDVDGFFPLYALKKVRKKWSLLTQGPERVKCVDDIWMDARPPWGELDEQGNEIDNSSL